MAALAEHDPLDAELLGRLGVLDGDASELNVVVPHPVVDGVVGGDLGRQGPAQARCFEDRGKCARVLGPGHDLARVMDQQDVRTFDVPRGLDLDPSSLGGVLIDELDIVLDDHRGHPGRGARLELQHRAVLMELARRDPHLLARDLADLTRQQRVVDADRTGLGAPAAHVAAIAQLDQARHDLPVEVNVAMHRRRGLLDVLEVDPAHDLGTVERTVELVVTALLVDVARLRARLAVGAVLHRHLEGRQEGPVVLTAHELLEAREETLDQAILLLLRGRLLD